MCSNEVQLSMEAKWNYTDKSLYVLKKNRLVINIHKMKLTLTQDEQDRLKEFTGLKLQ